MQVFPPDKGIFLHIPKCAGLSMEIYCIENGVKVAPLNRSQEWCDNINGGTHLERDVPEGIYGLWEEELDSPEYFTFAFVRNPWDRMVSAWRSQNLSQMYVRRSFKTFLNFIFSDEPSPLRSSHVLPYHDPSYRLFDPNGVQMVNYIGRFERLQEDFNLVCRTLGQPPQKLPHINKGDRGDRTTYSEFYDEELKEMIGARFAKDIAYFGYEFEE